MPTPSCPSCPLTAQLCYELLLPTHRMGTRYPARSTTAAKAASFNGNVQDRASVTRGEHRPMRRRSSEALIVAATATSFSSGCVAREESTHVRVRNPAAVLVAVQNPAGDTTIMPGGVANGR